MPRNVSRTTPSVPSVRLGTQWLLAPWFVYLAFFVVPALLTFLPVVNTFSGVSYETGQLLLLASGGFYMGILTIKAIIGLLRRVPRTTSVTNENPGRQRFKAIHVMTAYLPLAALFAVGLAALALELHAAGGVPLFMGSSVEKARLNLQVSGYVHVIAISTGTAAALFWIVSLYDRKRLRRIAVRGIAIVGLLAMLLTANRSYVFYPIVAVAAYYVLDGRARISWRFGVLAVLFVAFMGVLKSYRETEALGATYIHMVQSQLYIGGWFMEYVVYPVYLGITYNFVILDKLVHAGVAGKGGGIFTFHGLMSPLPGHQVNLGQLKNQWLGINFYSELTSTYVSSLFIDFGRIGAFWGSFALAAIAQVMYLLGRIYPPAAAAYAFLIARLVLIFYQYPFRYFNSYAQIILATIIVAALKVRLDRKANSPELVP